MHNKKVIIIALLLFIVLIGVFVRVNAQSSYKIYPDSYQSLVVAENIHNYGSVVAPLGDEGMLYPDFFGWTRPLYSLLINIVNTVTPDTETAAQAITLFAGIIAIFVAYLYIGAALRSRIAGLLGALLLAISFNHAVWSGFILSDTTGVLFLFLTLWLVFRNLHKEYGLANWYDLLTGAIFTLAILTRYEYAILALPLMVLMYTQNERPVNRLITVSAGGSFVLACAFFFLSPFTIDSSAIASQVNFFTGFFDSFDARGLIGFIFSDSILALSFIIGTILMFRERAHRQLAIFSLLSIALLAFLYYQTNPAMQRYFIHLIPFILLPASYTLTKVFQWSRKSAPLTKYAVAGLFVVGLLWQGNTAYQGLHPQNDGLWFTVGYEAEAAELVTSHIPEQALIIASFPEPYFLETKHSTQSIADVPPFIHIPDSLNDKTVIIIEDEGMRQIFPEFTKVLQNKAEKYKVREIPLPTAYRYGATIKNANEPIRLYDVKIGELKHLIEEKL